MKEVILRYEDMQVIYLPEKGMNFVSFKKGEKEVIEQSTRHLLEESNRGLGAMIGPHFHHRKKISMVPDDGLFPFIKEMKAKGETEFFSHGIARYVSWDIQEVTEKSLSATLSSKNRWKGVLLSDLEGMDFEMGYKAKLDERGLYISLSCKSSDASVIGLHTYYGIGKGKNVVSSQIKNPENLKKFEGKWEINREGLVTIEIDEAIDTGFFPFPDPLKAAILLSTDSHRVKVIYTAPSEENSWQLWHPKGLPFVCIEPLSAKDPRNPILKESNLSILIEIGGA